MTEHPVAALPVIDPSPFLRRRQAVLAHLAAHGGGVAVLPTAPEQTRNRDTHYPYRHDSYFYYLSGFAEPEAVIVLIADAAQAPRQILFCRDKDETREIWDGYRYGPMAAAEIFAFDEAWPIEELAQRLPDYLANQPTLWSTLGSDDRWDRSLMQALNAVRAQARSGVLAPQMLRELRSVLDEMRLIKDAGEQAIMRRAASISAAAHCRAMQATRPGRFEYEIEAELLHSFRRAGSQYPAYPSIVASGANACVLHYVDNNRQMRDGELLLIDAGCELDGYAADITRTFPVNGRFSAAQRAVYDIVLAAQQAATAAVHPGADWNAPHAAAVAVLTQGMVDLGLLSGSVDGLIESNAYQRFYMHRTGHWLGMDVHDAGDYKIAGQWRALQPGMVLTIEPGCYIRAAADVPQALWNIGIRIEDNALVTAGGCELITREVPSAASEIEALMRS